MDVGGNLPAKSSVTKRSAHQLAMPTDSWFTTALEIDDLGEHGEVFTRRWVVELILDLVGYTADRSLHRLVLVEPACGSGAFLRVVAERLSASCRKHGVDLSAARDAVQALDLLPRNVAKAKAIVTSTFLADGWTEDEAVMVAEGWVHAADFLLRWHEPETVDFVVGNPPYVRLEHMAAERSDAYRSLWTTMGGRSDIYVGFIEKGLGLLREGGRLGYICADRWMRNQYGASLRQLIGEHYAVETVISMHDVEAFEESVSAYPAITVLANHPQDEVVLVDTTQHFDEDAARETAQYAMHRDVSVLHSKAFTAALLPHWFRGTESWPHGSPERLAMIEYLSDNFPPLEDPATQTRVGIGVATGADGVYVVDHEVDVEPDRLLPLSMVRDIATGSFEWSGHYLVNPWDERGLVDLADYPRLERYFERHKSGLKKRNVAMKRPATWFRTIDRVHPALTEKPKLLLQDMRLTIHPVLDEGTAYPHHNLYYVVSDGWDLKVLGGLLLSDVANAFIEAYAVKMRGGTLRFQAQYLRRIRVPDPSTISEADRGRLAAAFEKRDRATATRVALHLYGLEGLRV